MPSSELKVPASSLVSELVLDIKITGVRTMTFRLWLATKLIALAGLIAGCNVETTNEP